MQSSFMQRTYGNYPNVKGASDMGDGAKDKKISLHFHSSLFAHLLLQDISENYFFHAKAQSSPSLYSYINTHQVFFFASLAPLRETFFGVFRDTLQYITLLFFLLSVNSLAWSQQTKDKVDYSKYPYWIKMMDDHHTNYFEAIKAYEEFWKNREKPLEEKELLNKKEDDAKGHHKKMSRREKRRQQEMDRYAYECKRFEHWKKKVFPYVQPDGRILTAEERLEIWKKQNNAK